MVTLTGDIAGTTGLIPTKISDVDYLEYNRKLKRVIFHIGNKTYFAAGDFLYWVDLIRNSGYTNFMIVDRNNAVNLNNIKVLDPVFKKAYFEYDIKDKVNGGCSMSWDKYKKVIELIGVHSPNAHIVNNL
ncbi:hypothetical protein [Paenibacillus sp. JDR-2]|uniref:hypothetical protein n=1 Tax=Paenibacillus sp. (strain JDR-2) TaxID=324057 RepID=UPI000166A453|nr:hypothetical protein [Paenibacillus sp. JDR-2]ACT00246.1 hypothetical protein Pjdr2_1576 [Paenibacillus sp. JDR-2]